MHFGYLNLQNIHCIAYCVRGRQLNSKGGGVRPVKITLSIPTHEILLCHDVFNINRPCWIGIDLQFSVKDFVSKYMHYVRYVGHPHLIKPGNALDNFSTFLILFIIFIQTVFINF